jgi:hypothetical protein
VISLNPTTAEPDPAVGDDEVEMANVTPQLVKKWAALAGRWKFSGKTAEYEGPDKPGMSSPLGLARASLPFRDGVIRTRIKLSRTEKTAGGILFGFQSVNSTYFSAALGAFDKAYAIVEHQPGIGWIERSSAGLLSNLSRDTEYEIRVSVTGQSVRLTVDEVEVLNYLVPNPIEGTGFGLYAWEEGSVTFTETTVLSSEPRVFVNMPFTEPFDTVYRDVILPVSKNLGFKVVRVDEVVGPGIIIEDIQQQIEGAHAVVAEISTHNPNVFYELGYAHALRKPAVLLVRRQEGETMPFDVSGYRAIFYNDSIGGKKIVERNLKQHLKAILGE